MLMEVVTFVFREFSETQIKYNNRLIGLVSARQISKTDSSLIDFHESNLKSEKASKKKKKRGVTKKLILLADAVFLFLTPTAHKISYIDSSTDNNNNGITFRGKKENSVQSENPEKPIHPPVKVLSVNSILWQQSFDSRNYKSHCRILFSKMTTRSSVISPDLTLLDSICIGSGRFLRAVLVPALVAADYHPCIIQTRGKSFLEFSCDKFSYEVDTVHYDGRVETTEIPYWGAGTLGTPEGKQDVLNLLASKKLGTSASKPFLVGIGVTEAGLSSASTKAMTDLYDILKCLCKRNAFQRNKICVINTDNVSQNGTLMQKYMNELASGDQVMETFCNQFVIFHNTMVDRITSQRPEAEMIPRAEPTPSKALVIEDLESILQPIFGCLRESHGVVIRSKNGQLDADIALKLRVANGTHTAAAHTMALTGLVMTDVLSSGSEESKLLLNYLDMLVANQIVPGVEATADFSATKTETQAVYEDWRRRLIHAHFGLSTFFITQNGAAKGGIRIGPTIRDLIQSSSQIQCSTVFALAALLRFLTHTGTKTKEQNLYIGWFDPKRHEEQKSDTGPVDLEKDEESKTIPYADGLLYNISEGWYCFRCDCTVCIDGEETPLPMALYNIGLKQQPVAYEPVIESYLCQPNGGNLGNVSDTKSFTILIRAVATLYARMMAGDALMDILGSLDLNASCESLVDGEW